MRLVFTPIILIAVFCSAAHAQQLLESSKSRQEDVADYVAKAQADEKRFDYNDAITWFEKAAELGDGSSMNELGWIYFGAHDIPGRRLEDRRKAAFWFQKAADSNYLPAITQLGVMYKNGSSPIPEDRTKAALLFLKAAQAGDAQAMNNLAVLYMQGDGVPKDMARALEWWRKAAETDKGGMSGKAARSWLDLYRGKLPFP